MPRITGKRALLEQLVADGVRYIFGNPGTTEQGFMDLLQDYPQVEFILCLHEGVAIGMADAFARATRKPAFVELHIAPGLGNAVGMLFNAKVGRSPLVVYVGQSASRALFQEPLLSGDLVEIAAPVTKWSYEITHAADVPQAVRRAMKIAEEAPQGPTVLSIPIDVLDEDAEVSIQPTSYTRWRAHPDPAAMDEAAELLAASRRPMIVTGDGIALSNGQEHVTRLAELLGAPIYQGYTTEVNVDANHPLVIGTLPFTNAAAPEFTSRVLARHDVVLALGVPLFRYIFPRPGDLVPAATKVIQIDLDGWEIGKNVPGALGIKADCAAALLALLERLESRAPAGAVERAAAIAAEGSQKRETVLANDRKTWTNQPISVARLMSELADVVPADAVIFDEAITSSTVLQRYVAPRPGRYFRARGGGLGPGLPGALGVKLAMPERPVVGVVADGSAMYSVSAFWTAAHHRIPVTWVVCNNASYRILKENIMDYLGPRHADRKFVAMDLTDPPLRYDRIAESMGVRGRRVERPEDLRPALEEALGSGAPAVVDVAIQRDVR
ncbi:MAG TPA: thiamine pyrophosphate-binding protein [bacterium]|nr:thiamine pyrophosphate-binding protein [bacterium]